MTPNRITKLYDSLTTKQRAALVFNHSGDSNEVEIRRISATIPVISYRSRDPEYFCWLNYFFEMASTWAITHWRGRCATLAAMWSGYTSTRQHNYTGAETSFQEAQQGEGRLMALDDALDAVCNDHGIDPAAVRRLAGTERYCPLKEGVSVDLAYREQVRMTLSGILSAD